MTRAEILTLIATDKECLNASRRISGYSELSADLFAEMLEIMCGLDDDKLTSLHANDELRWYVVAVLVNMWQSTSSPFYHAFRKPLAHKCLSTSLDSLREIIEEYDLDKDLAEQTAIEVSQEIIDEFQSIDRDGGSRKKWYDSTLFNLYLKSKSYREASKSSGIPTMTIHHAVRRMKLIITEKIELKANGKKK